MTTQSADRVAVHLSRELTRVLDENPMGSVLKLAAADPLFDCLELFVPRALRVKYPEWERESIDGFRVARAARGRAQRVELVGLLILISDQTVAPFQLELDLESGAATAPIIRVGEPGGGRLGISGPPCNSKEAREMLSLLLERVEKIQWSYTLEEVGTQSDKS